MASANYDQNIHKEKIIKVIEFKYCLPAFHTVATQQSASGM